SSALNSGLVGQGYSNSGSGPELGTVSLPDVPVLHLSPRPIKIFHFSWEDVSGEGEYRLLEDPDGRSGYTQVASIAANSESHELEVFLPMRINARYILQACSSDGCVDSAPAGVSGTLAE